MFNKNKNAIEKLQTTVATQEMEIPRIKNDLTKVAERVGEVEFQLKVLETPSKFNCGDGVIYNGAFHTVAEITPLPNRCYGGPLTVDWRYRLTDLKGCLLSNPNYFTEKDLISSPEVNASNDNMIVDEFNKEPEIPIDITLEVEKMVAEAVSKSDANMLAKIEDIGSLFKKLTEKTERVTETNKLAAEALGEMSANNEAYRVKIQELERQVWALNNPSEHNCGDTVCYRQNNNHKVVSKEVKTDQNGYGWFYFLVDGNDELVTFNKELLNFVPYNWVSKPIAALTLEKKKKKKGKKKLLKG